MIISVVGLDPGPTTGMAFLDYHQLPGGLWSPVPEALLLQAEGNAAVLVLEAMLKGRYGPDRPVAGRFGSVERFVTGRSAGTGSRASDPTRQLVMMLTECLQLYGYAAKLRSAADVKPWASDKRLIRAGIATAGSGIHGKLRDGYDGGRHALFCAVQDARMPDPLARTASQ